MSRFALSHDWIKSPLAMALLALVLLNPFCCHLLPYHEVGLVQENSVLAEYDGVCVGKPEALSDRTADVIPVVWFWVITLCLTVLVGRRAVTQLGWTGLLRHAGPPRHKVFSVFLI
jgi:hypothetical protein